jgi:hypothetical protein
VLSANVVDITTFVALQFAVVPPFEPAHVHVHGPVPEILDVVPVTQRLVVGADESVAPLLVPHVPLIGVGVGVGVGVGTQDGMQRARTIILSCMRISNYEIF